ncbi:DUF3093 domain-containing protein [Microbacterium stercoris]|uniref:DUF3093 domain-containing protein n=1 Tax=Microbacterium stercoris TaxID=2820289 RepID=A0A939QKC5_9MICO|nr:DUF3093 domain-containing protein [Microbacterium stercoris]MBO3662515.1 DUF3093 domain-containing protein [Microbacterium stercoris]MBO3664507.1 DUF3093 domain-containing protein [Microbacterium stercoris]
MQNTTPPARPSQPPRAESARPLYRERLTPSLWILGSAAVVAPMASLVFVRMDGALSLAIGFAVGVAVITALILGSPVIEVVGRELRAGRAHIDVALLGEPVPLTDEAARAARSTGLDARGWHLIRGGVAGIVVLPDIDPDDPVSSWTLSSRTPDRLAAAVRHAQSAG